MSHFTSRSRLDGETRTYTLLRTSGPVFFLLVSLSREEYLRAWHQEILLAGLAVSGLIALSIAVSWQARAAWSRHLSFQQRLAQEEARFRLLAENALDVVWTLDRQGNLTYISPAIQKQRGWTPEEFRALDPSQRTLRKAFPSLLQDRIASSPE